MSKMRKVLISSFILFSFLTMIRVHVPLDAKIYSTIYRPVDSYLSFFSIYQDWLMFAPNPTKLNVFITADVEFEDGSSASYDFEHSNSDSLLEKYSYGEKYRKFVTDGLRKDENAFLRIDAAKFALRKLKGEHFYKIPLKVHLTRHWYETLDPAIEFRPHRIKPAVTYQTHRFFTYEVI